MDGGDRAGYKQISKNVDSRLLTSTSGSVAGDWYGFEIISTGAQIALITASGFTGSSMITSGTTYPRGAWFGGGKITAIKLSTGTVGGAKKASKVIAYNRVLL
jgi:hypothetical protein